MDTNIPGVPERRQANIGRIEGYMRGTCHAAVFVAWTVGIMAALSIVATIVLGLQFHTVYVHVTTPPSCASVGGTDSSC